MFSTRSFLHGLAAASEIDFTSSLNFSLSSFTGVTGRLHTREAMDDAPTLQQKLPPSSNDSLCCVNAAMGLRIREDPAEVS